MHQRLVPLSVPTTGSTHGKRPCAADDHGITNAQRAAAVGPHVEAIMQAMLTEPRQLGREEQHELFADILTNLMHWCDRNRIDFATAMQDAARSYTAECYWT